MEDKFYFSNATEELSIQSLKFKSLLVVINIDLFKD